MVEFCIISAEFLLRFVRWITRLPNEITDAIKWNQQVEVTSLLFSGQNANFIKSGNIDVLMKI